MDVAATSSVISSTLGELRSGPPDGLECVLVAVSLEVSAIDIHVDVASSSS